jgi:hypothetical protein
VRATRVSRNSDSDWSFDKAFESAAPFYASLAAVAGAVLIAPHNKLEGRNRAKPPELSSQPWLESWPLLSLRQPFSERLSSRSMVPLWLLSLTASASLWQQ